MAFLRSGYAASRRGAHCSTLRGSGFGTRGSGSGFGTRDSGFGIRDSGFGTRGSGLGIRDSGFGTRDSGQVRGSGLGVRGSGFGVGVAECGMWNVETQPPTPSRQCHPERAARQGGESKDLGGGRSTAPRSLHSAFRYAQRLGRDDTSTHASDWEFGIRGSGSRGQDSGFGTRVDPRHPAISVSEPRMSIAPAQPPSHCELRNTDF